MASQLAHVLGEYSKAETDYKDLEKYGSGPNSPWFNTSHNRGGLPAEGRVMSDFTGKAEGTPGRREVEGVPLVTFEYTSVRYLVQRQTQAGTRKIKESVEKVTRRVTP